MKLTTITHVSVDGVMQGLGGSDEDRRGGFERGGWALPIFDNEAETFLGEVPARRRVSVRPADLRAPVPAGVRLVRPRNRIDGGFVDTIRAAIMGAGPLERNWTFVESGPRGVVAGRNGVVFLVPHDSVDNKAPQPKPNGNIAVRQPSCLRSPQPGFCLVLGNNALPALGSEPLIRLYLNIFSDGAAALTRVFSRELNDRSVPFALKLVNTEDGYTRCDSTVLYVPGEHLVPMLDVVARRHADFAWAFKEGVPALTKRLTNGIGAAEDPGSGESFGQHRCRLLAEALCDPAVSRARGAERRSREMVTWLERRGISIAEPYLGPGSPDRLVLPTLYKNRQHGNRGAEGCRRPHRSELVAAAAGVGEILLAEALWWENGCTWMGPRHEASLSSSTSAQRRSWSSVGGDVYSGTAGIACFLATLADLLDDNRFGRAAAGALVNAAQEVERSIRPMDASLYLGWTGVVFCLLRLDRRLNRPELVNLGERIVRERLGRDLVCEANDWLAGLAGNISGLLALAREGVGGPVVDAADRLGQTLLARAVQADGVYTWRDRGHAAIPLTGLAHGAAGIALALAELAAATGHNEYRTAALGAVEYEHRRFSPTQNNWPDFRRPAPIRFQGRGGRRYAVAWCHGAPGIALGRMRVWKLLGDNDLFAEAMLGFETTVRSLSWLIGDGMERIGLCHGLSGNLLIVRTVERQGLVSPEKHATTTNAATRQLRAVAELAGIDGGLSRWMRESPSLLTGAAGIGHLLLYEAGADTTSLLEPSTHG